MSDIEETRLQAHKHSANHLNAVNNSSACGCFYCCSVFTPDAIERWVDDGQTALCPRCNIDGVIGDASGYPVNDTQFLQYMNRQWFQTKTTMTEHETRQCHDCGMTILSDDEYHPYAACLLYKSGMDGRGVRGALREIMEAKTQYYRTLRTFRKRNSD